MNNRIGIMQGRLSKPINGKIQSFPADNWEREFELAAEIGYSNIEWVIDNEGIENNPLFSRNKSKTIFGLIKKYNISIPAVCHDQLMEFPLHSSDNKISTIAQKILIKTMEVCGNFGIQFIEIPLIGKASLNQDYYIQRLTDTLSNLDAKAREYGLSFILETDLSPESNAKMMEKMSGISVGLNYDMGNSAYWGFDPDHELPLIGMWIKNVHVKDCTPKDYTLPLGEGDVDFKKVFNHLKNQNYNGLFILQAAPAERGKEKGIAKQYFQFTQNQLGNYYNES
jgi:L-ribulose-5-phosphate 3-epimerase